MNKLPNKTTRGEDIPEPARPEILMGKTETKYIDDNLIWACKRCDFNCITYRAMVGHMANKHKFITIHENNRIRCPFCPSTTATQHSKSTCSSRTDAMHTSIYKVHKIR